MFPERLSDSRDNTGGKYGSKGVSPLLTRLREKRLLTNGISSGVPEKLSNCRSELALFARPNVDEGTGKSVNEGRFCNGSSGL